MRRDATTSRLTAETARRLLEYNPQTGMLTWKPRSPSMFTDGKGKYTSEWKAKCWNALYAGKEAGAMDGHGYRHVVILTNHRCQAHRLAWLIFHGIWPKTDIDHINHDRQDNRMANLRIVNRQENLRNQGSRRTSKSGLLGVEWCPWISKWRSRITVDGKSVHLGVFHSKEEAMNARRAGERQYGFHENHGLSLGASRAFKNGHR